jgi:hypothetical protein
MERAQVAGGGTGPEMLARPRIAWRLRMTNDIVLFLGLILKTQHSLTMSWWLKPVPVNSLRRRRLNRGRDGGHFGSALY